MRLYLLRGDLDYDWLRPADPRRWHWRSGVPVSFEWRTPQLELQDSDDRNGFVPVDCLAMNTGCDGPILSGFAVEALGELLRPAGEVWPVRVLARQYWWFNCLALANVLDCEGTEADWEVVRGDWGEFRWITLPRRLAFDPAGVSRAPGVFRVPEFPEGVLFVGDAFEQAVARHGLTGFRLDLIWSSEAGGVRDPAGFGMSEVFEQRPPGEVARKRARARAVLDERRAHAGDGR